MVELYLTHTKGGDDVPLYSLKGFKRITLRPGASEKVKFTTTPDMMQLINELGDSQINAGDIKVSIAGSLPSKRSEELGAAKPAEATLSIK